MNNAIESGRETIRFGEQIERSCGEIFNTGIEILRKKGATKALIPHIHINEYTVFNYVVNSSVPAVEVAIWAGANLDKARIVTIQVKGVGWLESTKRVVKGQEKFKGKRHTQGSSYAHNLDPDYSNLQTVVGYLNAIRQVKREITPH